MTVHNLNFIIHPSSSSEIGSIGLNYIMLLCIEISDSMYIMSLIIVILVRALQEISPQHRSINFAVPV